MTEGSNASGPAAETIPAPPPIQEPPPPAAPAGAPQLPKAARSLFALVAAGVATSGWFLFYTDYFPILGGLLGLGGLFTWLAFLGNLLTKERKEGLQCWFDARVLENAHALRWIVGVWVVSVLPFFFLSSLRLDSLEDQRSRVVYLQPADAVGGDLTATPAKVLAPRTRRKLLRWAPPWGRGFEVKVSGLPAQSLRLFPWWRRTLAVPDDFGLRPILLVRPTAGVGATARNQAYTLEVEIEGRLVATGLPYRGESVWVGCRRDVEIPEVTRQRWRAELAAEKADENALAYWLTPLEAVPGQVLEPGHRVVVRVLRPREGAYAAAEATIEPRLDPRLPPQFEVMAPL